MKLSEWIQTHPKLSFYFRNQMGPKVAQLEAGLADVDRILQIEMKENAALKRERHDLMHDFNKSKQIAVNAEADNAALKRENKGLLGIVSAYHPEYLRGCDCPQCSDALRTAEEQEDDTVEME